MKIKRKVNIEEEVDIKYIKADFGVLFFEDAEVNGRQDSNENPSMPFIEGRRWQINVDIDRGCILNWPKNVLAHINYKVRDNGKYEIYDSNKMLILKKEGYVPEIFGQDYMNFGDYVSITVNDEGLISNWKVTEEMLADLLQ